MENEELKTEEIKEEPKKTKATKKSEELEKALGSIRTECTVIGIDSDRLFPVEEQKLIASCIPGSVYHEITSKFGHDGFLLENDQLTAIIQPLLP